MTPLTREEYTELYCELTALIFLANRDSSEPMGLELARKGAREMMANFFCRGDTRSCEHEAA